MFIANPPSEFPKRKPNTNEILEISGALSGKVGCCYKLGIDKDNGDLFYRAADNTWQPVPNGGGGGTQRFGFPAEDVTAGQNRSFNLNGHNFLIQGNSNDLLSINTAIFQTLLQATDGTGFANMIFNSDVAGNNVQFYVSATDNVNLVQITGDAIAQIINLGAGNGVEINSAYLLPPIDGSANQVLTTDGAGTVTWQNGGGGGGSGWNITGNAGTIAGTNFIGTTDNVAFNFRVNNILSGKIEAGIFSSVSLGQSSLPATSTGVSQVAIGSGSLNGNTTGTRNNALGHSALNKNTTGVDNTAIGWSGQGWNTIGIGNTSVGSGAMNQVGSTPHNGGTYNTAIGYLALEDNWNNNYNIGLGANAGIGSTDSNTLYVSPNTTKMLFNLDVLGTPAPNTIGVDGSGFWHVYDNPSGGSTLFALSGTNTATGDVTGDLNSHILLVQQGGNEFLRIDPTSGTETINIQSPNITDGSRGILTLEGGVASGFFNIAAVDIPENKNASIAGDAESGQSNLQYVADTHNFINGSVNTLQLTPEFLTGTSSDGVGSSQIILSSNGSDQNFSLYASDGTNNVNILGDAVAKTITHTAGTHIFSGLLEASNYGSGTNTGTPTYLSAFNTTGDVIELLANNGLSYSGGGDALQLGGTLIKNTTITADAFSLTINGTGSQQLVNINHTDGIGLISFSTNNVAINAISTNSIAGSFESTNSIGIEVVGGDVFAGTFNSIFSSTNTIGNVVAISGQTTGTAAIGFGCSIDFQLQRDNGGSISAGTVGYVWESPVAATYTSKFIVSTALNGAGTTSKLEISGAGAAKLNNYGIGTFTGTPKFGAAFDGSGNIIEIAQIGTVASADLTGQTAAVSSIATFTPTANGTFRIGGYINVTAIVTNVITFKVTYTDINSNAVTQIIPLTLAATGAVGTTATIIGNNSATDIQIRAKSGSAITVLTTVTGVGSETYDVGATIEKLR